MAMKPEIWHPDFIVESCINNRLRTVEWSVTHTDLFDPYYEYVSMEKFALQTLLQEISEHGDVSPTNIIEGFAKKASQSIDEGKNPHINYVFSVFRDTAMSILEDAYYGF